MNSTERITTIEELAGHYANSMKGYKLVSYYKAAFPVYRISSELVIQRKKELGLIQEFCLKYLRAGAKNVNNLKNFLGLDEKVVTSNLLTLHQLDMVNYRFATQEVILTPKGIEALEKNNFVVPEIIDYTFLIDGITGDYQINQSLDRAEKIKNNSHIIPFLESKPDIDVIDIKSVKNIVNIQKHLNNSSYLEADILAVKNIEKIEKFYRKLNILVFMNDCGNYELQVYDVNKRNQKYEAKLMVMLRKNFKIIPTVEFDIEMYDTSNSLIDKDKVEILANEKDNLIDVIDTLERRVEEAEKMEVNTEEDYLTKTMQIDQLRKELEKEKLKEKAIPKLINTYEHRPILIRALNEAKKQVVIVSPWIKETATDFELRGAIQKAMERKVKVVICYGISKKIESDVNYAVNLLKKLKEDKTYGKYLSLVLLGNTHEKVLICDEVFTVVTSFNWLSFKGDKNRGFRQETGTYVEDFEFSKNMISNLQERILASGNSTNIKL
ncbi:phospholipase D-like domain-containing protein [Clostridium sp. CAG:265]|uniref:phospholipase D-like domain-containing protein n=1 Tax=Clostridium sp. CAG:265 TaxID=1262787 RepID=UPI00033738FD|nr:phospholipase D-like domain-containing protein [Clostridium sp. CAG:265]CDB74325.1 putative uncharacterized protein [Clostridium sp. CAG:265]